MNSKKNIWAVWIWIQEYFQLFMELIWAVWTSNKKPLQEQHFAYELENISKSPSRTHKSKILPTTSLNSILPSRTGPPQKIENPLVKDRANVFRYLKTHAWILWDGLSSRVILNLLVLWVILNSVYSRWELRNILNFIYKIQFPVWVLSFSGFWALLEGRVFRFFENLVFWRG